MVEIPTLFLLMALINDATSITSGLGRNGVAYANTSRTATFFLSARAQEKLVYFKNTNKKNMKFKKKRSLKDA